MFITSDKKKEILKRFESKKIAVLYGGTNEEREVSLRSGANIYDALTSFDELKENITLIDVQDGESLVNRLKKENIEFCYNILHGKNGEDGTVQGLLDMLQIKYTGESVLVSALCMDKIKTKTIWKAYNIESSNFDLLDNIINENDQCLYSKSNESFKFPFIIKPIASGSSCGVHLIKNIEQYLRVKNTINTNDYLIEDYLKGTEVTVGLVKDENSGDGVFTFPILGIYPKNEIYDYEAKYTPQMTDFQIPALLDKKQEKRLIKNAIMAYNVLSCRGVCRIDAIVSEDEINLLECNTQGGMTNTSDIPEMAKASNIEFRDIVLYILGLIE